MNQSFASSSRQRTDSRHALNSTPSRKLNKDQPRIALFLLDSKKDILRGIAKYVREFGPWRLFLQPTQGSESLPGWLKNWRGDGIIGRITDVSTARLVRGTGLPFVDVRGTIRHPDIPLVRIDDEAVGRIAADHLLGRGFKHFAYYGPAKEIWATPRRDAFIRAIREASGSSTVNEQPWVVRGAGGWEAAEAELALWLGGLRRPAGVLAASDRHGQRLLGAARRAAIKVPEELAVLGVDNDEATCEVCDPPLSSVIIDSVQQGYKAAALLHRLMQGQPLPNEPILIKPSGVQERQSTDMLAIEDPFIADAVRFIRDHACEGIRVSDVLREVPLSRSVLQRRFRRIFGQTANDMIVEMRLRRAQNLLIGTDLSISKIAEIAGFRYQRYLGAVFRKKLGVTPFRYRQQAGPGRNLGS